MATDNKLLGTFVLQGIPPAPRGVPQIEVTFDIDANGILHVTALDKGTNKKQSIQIVAAQKLNEKEVEEMRKQAEAFAEQDTKRKEEVETVNQADALVYSTEKMLEDMKDKISSSTKEKVQKGVAELKEMLGREPKPIAELKARMETFNKELQQIGSELYKQGANPAPNGETNFNGGNPQDEPGKGDAVDAEFKVHDENEKK